MRSGYSGDKRDEKSSQDHDSHLKTGEMRGCVSRAQATRERWEHVGQSGRVAGAAEVMCCAWTAGATEESQPRTGQPPEAKRQPLGHFLPPAW